MAVKGECGGKPKVGKAGDQKPRGGRNRRKSRRK